jgi:diguanylate cyclase (GGDEF)-like protein
MASSNPKSGNPGVSAAEAAISHLQRLLAQKDALLQQQSATLAHMQKIFDRSSKAARIGVWECSLPDEQLFWTDMVYELFDLPQEVGLERDEIVKCYTEESREQLIRLRNRAIENRGGFSMDAEIVTPKGNRRWIRITATVECEDDRPVRIFGMKLDITAEKMMFDQIRHMAEFDTLTGLNNRSQFQQALHRLCDTSQDQGAGALVLLDLDNFKAVNDTFGHQAGDDCLKETASRLKEIWRDSAFVARIGGDEFAIIAQADIDYDLVVRLTDETLRSLNRVVETGARSIAIGASAGIAVACGVQGSEVFALADAALYEAKGAGKNQFRFSGPPMKVQHSSADAA